MLRMRISKRQSAFRRFLCACVLNIQFVDSIFAQSNPNLYFGFTPTVGQWNSYFAGKADYPGLFNAANIWTNINTFSGLANFSAGTWTIFGATSGSAIITTSANAGNWTWIWPNTLGDQGYSFQYGGTGNPSWGLSWYTLGGYAQNVNLNSVADTQINLSVPTKTFIITSVNVLNTGTSSSFASGSFSLCSLPGASGTCFVTNSTLTGITGIGVNKIHNIQVAALQNEFTTITTWYFRVTTPVGVAATATVLLPLRVFPEGFP